MAIAKKDQNLVVAGIEIECLHLHKALAWPGHPAELTLSEKKFKGMTIHRCIGSNELGELMEFYLLTDAKGKQQIIELPNVANATPKNKIEISVAK